MIKNPTCGPTPPASQGQSVNLTRASLFLFTGLLTLVLLFAGALATYFALNLDRTEAKKAAFLADKAVQSLRKNVLATTKDYAFWGDAYRNLHLALDTEWAFVQENLGPTLFPAFGFNGVFVIGTADQTLYSVIDGKRSQVPAAQWLGEPLDQLVREARAQEEHEKSVSAFVRTNAALVLIGAAAITPGTDPTVQRDDGLASVLVFARRLDNGSLESLGNSFGVEHLRLAQRPALEPGQVMDKAKALATLAWSPPTPGREILAFMLPLLGLFALLVYLMVWIILRRATAAAKLLDLSHVALQRSQGALAISEARFRDVAEASSDWIWEVDDQGRFTYLSERFEIITGFAREAWLGIAIEKLVKGEEGSLLEWLNHRSRSANASFQCTCVDKEGGYRILRVTARDMQGQGYRGTAVDITDDVEARKRIEYLSEHDVLTGLPNRERLRDFLEGRLRSASTGTNPLVMFSIDLDRFKPVNDLLGHAVGDRVLLETARRLGECVRSGDLVARVGGDEFVMVVTGMLDHVEIEALCRRLIDAVEQPIQLEEQNIFISASIGIALSPSDAREAAELLRYSDIALYEAKASGRGTWRFYAGDMNARIIERRRLESDLRYGIKNGELRLYFQPRFRISDGQMVGAEALVRWQHPQRGLVYPDTFIPIAEDTGLIASLSDWVLDAACKTAADWPEELFVSVNLSSKEFQSTQLIERIERVLAVSRLQPARLELELTESVMVEDATSALSIMRSLKALGVKLAMDDFGTGYSSLSYLRSFPFDGLKIDRSFVSRLGESEDDKAIIQAIVGLGRALSLTVTAEGIETPEHLALLKAVTCDEGQGYHLSRPMDAVAFNQMMMTT
ncbi:EAL domain-containing protein [Pseudomonas capeferrum]|uniref:bifunctional diguanylate cyclase/phosphodiesterase n=1 Tax=Pseudomonas capeferrum TaxID=1495066 RepID=UPI0015E32F15|nr:EAL domain-containing protein [Pseudomonas capeferrum]MBA1200798.1 EAL domain-containing protein [Pseudomonas capeferrum]